MHRRVPLTVLTNPLGIPLEEWNPVDVQGDMRAEMLNEAALRAQETLGISDTDSNYSTDSYDSGDMMDVEPVSLYDPEVIIFNGTTFEVDPDILTNTVSGDDEYWSDSSIDRPSSPGPDDENRFDYSNQLIEPPLKRLRRS